MTVVDAITDGMVGAAAGGRGRVCSPPPVTLWSPHVFGPSMASSSVGLSGPGFLLRANKKLVH